MKLIKESWQVLTEDDKPVSVVLSDEERINPSSIDLKKIVSRRQGEAKAKEEADALAAKKAENAEKYKDLLSQLTGEDAEKDLEVLFDALVPSNGKADTVAGEIVRAMMRLLYRDYNDGDKFYEGYGLDVAAPAAAYLMSLNDLNVRDDFVKIAEDAGQFEADFNYDDQYTDGLKAINEKVVDYIKANPELLSEPNETDSREFDITYIKANLQPGYEYWLEVPWEIQEYIDAGKISIQDVAEQVEEWLNWDAAFNGCEVYTNYRDSITVDELTREGYETLQDWDDHSLWEDYIQDLENEYGNLEDEDEEESDDEDLDESLNEKKDEGKKINKGTVGYILTQNKSLIDSIGAMTKAQALDTLRNLFEKNKEDLQWSYAEEVLRNAARKKSAVDILIYLYNILLAQQDLKVL